MKLHPVKTLIAALPVLIIPLAACADSSDLYLRPTLKVGQHLSSVFSKTISIKGSDFDEYTRRIAGSANNTVTGVTADAVTFNSNYRYDGYSNGSGDFKILRDGITYCYQEQCSVNNQTSGVLFNPLLWGSIPKTLEPGAHWTAYIDRTWEIGPRGNEQVRVVRLDSVNHVVTLAREGRGTGPSSDDEAMRKSDKQVLIETDGKQLAVSVVPGESRWSGYTTICNGVVVSDVLMVQRHVTLVGKDGEQFKGEERSYTLFNFIDDPV